MLLQSHFLILLAAASGAAGQCPKTAQERKQRCPLRLSPWLVTKPLQNDSCCAVSVGPIKLLETGSSIVDPQEADIKERFDNASCAVGKEPALSCFSPPSYYRQYTNAYNGTDYGNGIPIMSAFAQNETLEQVREYVSLLLKWSSRTIPNVAEYMNKAYIRVLINPCKNFDGMSNNWAPHPEGDAATEQGGANRPFPSVGAEESGMFVAGGCLWYPRLPVIIEEFFHTIHDVAMKEQDPDAFAAIICVSARDVSSGLVFGHLTPNTTTAELRIRAALAGFDHDWVSTVSLEYYMGAVSIWMGYPMSRYDFLFADDAGSSTSARTTSRALLKKNLPDVACLVARYFPDVGEDDGEFCAKMRTNASNSGCQLFPGSCYCSDTMTTQYLGPALNRSRCPTLQQIKEQSGFKDKPLPGDAAEVPCRGCLVAGCDVDRGLRRTVSPNPSGGPMNLNAPSAAAATHHSVLPHSVLGSIFILVLIVTSLVQ
eukprot:scpid72736/ scgid22083/ 